MKHIQVILFLFFISFTSAAGQVPDSLKFKLLRPVEFQQACISEQKAVLIDVREFFEYRKTRIKGALNIPSSGKLSSSADTLDKSKPLFLYCTSGFRSKRVAKFFCANGFTSVYSLDGGIIAWKKEGKEVDRKRVRKQDARRRENSH
jgi:rhodanese-related sulfurtransferase